jgi:hypothetical protein
MRSRREKMFGPGRAVPLDRNAKARIMAYAKAWGARHRQPGQHRVCEPQTWWPTIPRRSYSDHLPRCPRSRLNRINDAQPAQTGTFDDRLNMVRLYEKSRTMAYSVFR